MVQVKTGFQLDEANLFSTHHLHSALAFIGCLPAAQLDGALARLEQDRVVEVDGWTIGKLLVSPNTRAGNYLSCELQHALGFIRQRIGRHAVRKAADRMFFPDELIQFLAWEASLDRR